MSWQRQELLGVLMVLLFFGLPILAFLHWPGDGNFWFRVAIDEPVGLIPIVFALVSYRR